VTIGSVFRGILPFGAPFLFRKATERTVDSFADLRWGPDGKGYRRMLHPNAVWLLGHWEITEESEYSGYFRKGSRGLFMGRYSSGAEVLRGKNRSLSLVGKLYPTTDPEHAEPLRTASFFTQEDIGGARTPSIQDAELRNAPDTHVFRRGLATPVLLLSGIVFGRVDRVPDERQLYEVAELGKPAGEPTKCPAYMRLLVAPGQAKAAGDTADFRNEVLGQIYDRGNPTPQRTLTFTIEVTDEGDRHGPPIAMVRTFRNWRRIGQIVFNEAVASYNGDFVVHVHHPTWRQDRNDPATATRVNGKKVG
jgi:hypothetical protein